MVIQVDAAGQRDGVIACGRQLQPLASNQTIVAEGGNFSFPVGITIVPAQDPEPTPVPGASWTALLTAACLVLASSRVTPSSASGRPPVPGLSAGCGIAERDRFALIGLEKLLAIERATVEPDRASP